VMGPPFVVALMVLGAIVVQTLQHAAVEVALHTERPRLTMPPVPAGPVGPAGPCAPIGGMPLRLLNFV